MNGKFDRIHDQIIGMHFIRFGELSKAIRNSRKDTYCFSPHQNPIFLEQTCAVLLTELTLSL
jgi:hypothetical protein